jgi:hypothetical protein
MGKAIQDALFHFVVCKHKQYIYIYIYIERERERERVALINLKDELSHTMHM